MKLITTEELASLPYGTIFADASGYINQTVEPIFDGDNIYWYSHPHPSLFSDYGICAAGMTQRDFLNQGESVLLLERADIEAIVAILRASPAMNEAP